MRLTIALLTLFVLSPLASAADQAKPLKALLITGGCCHDFENQKKILTEGISARVNVEWEIIHEGEGPRKGGTGHRISIYEKDDWAKEYDVVVHNECFADVNDVPFVERVAKAHYDGVPGVVIHCTMHTFRGAKTDEWRKFLGVTSTSHERARPVVVKNLKSDHPVMKYFPSEWKTPNGELYIISKLGPDTTPLAQAFGQDTKKDHTVIWTNQYGKARVFGTTLGHHNETMGHEVYLDFISRGLLWACDKLDESGKPKAGYGPK